ncbi:HNH endonuclease [Treponema sp. R6D11]
MTEKKLHKPCPVCGQVMNRQSKQCRNCYLVFHKKPESYVERICPKCGKSFQVHKAQINRGQGKYCSKKCAVSHQPRKKNTHIKQICVVCGKKLERHPSDMQKSINKKVFCSPKCWYQYNQEKNHYSWGGGQDDRMCPKGRTWRKLVIERDKGICRLCHSSIRPEAHHIKPFRSHPELRYDLDNGITLCHECHLKLARNESIIEKELSIIAKEIQLVIWEI